MELESWIQETALNGWKRGKRFEIRGVLKTLLIDIRKSRNWSVAAKAVCEE